MLKSTLICCCPLNSVFWGFRDNSAALSPQNWRIYGGMVSLNILPAPYLVEKIIVNENYDSKTNDQDVALLKLTSPVTFNGQLHLYILKKMYVVIQPL